MQYDAYSCNQRAEEAQRVSARATAMAGAQDSQATKNAVATTVGVTVFWPALFGYWLAVLVWRKGWDSNPRGSANPLAVFKTAALNHSATLPTRPLKR
jgi:hypothetical protein